jgi:hypothetical protein
MIHLITYADHNFEKAKHRLCKEAENTGWFDTIEGFSPDDLDIDFKNKYNHILKFGRIAGYGIWRPYIIKQSLKNINENDILIYLDAGCSINKQGDKRFYEYISMVNDDNPVISFQMTHLEYKYTTKEIFDYFNIIGNDNIIKTGQILDGILIMRKNNNLMKLIESWYKVIEDNPLLFTDHYNKNQPSGFIDNRHEQSIFSVIRKMNNPLLLNDETYFTPFGNNESLKYPFWATRKRT